MKVLVCGSRTVDAFACWERLERRLQELDFPLVVTGGARGADAVAHRCAKHLGCETRTFRAHWERDGRRAGILRNLRMLDEQPELVIALWDGASRGTAHTISEARRRGIAVEILDA